MFSHQQFDHMTNIPMMIWKYWECSLSKSPGIICFYVEVHVKSMKKWSNPSPFGSLNHPPLFHSPTASFPFPFFSLYFPLAITTAPALTPFHTGTLTKKFGSKSCYIKKSKQTNPPKPLFALLSNNLVGGKSILHTRNMFKLILPLKVMVFWLSTGQKPSNKIISLQSKQHVQASFLPSMLQSWWDGATCRWIYYPHLIRTLTQP